MKSDRRNLLIVLFMSGVLFLFVRSLVANAEPMTMEHHHSMASMSAPQQSFVALHSAGQSTVVTIEVSNFSFIPISVTIQPGDTVVWQRTSGFHNVKADNGDFTLGENSAGDPGSTWTTVSHTFTSAGEFRYYCQVHGGTNGSGMSGMVVVQDAAQESKLYLPLVTRSS